MTLPVYCIRLGTLGLRLRNLPAPPPSSWILHAVPSAVALPAAADFSCSLAAVGEIEARARQLARDSTGGERRALDATHPVTGATDSVSWIGEALIARRDDEGWALLLPANGARSVGAHSAGAPSDAAAHDASDATGAAPWCAHLVLSDRRPLDASLAFFDTLMPFVVARCAVDAGGFFMHGNALLMPPSQARPRRAIVLTGPSGAGKSTLSRLLARDRTDTLLIAEDRVLVLPTPGGRGFCAAAYPTAGERWLRSEARSRAAANRLVAIVAVGAGKENRLEQPGCDEGFVRLWEQTFPSLVDGPMARKLVDNVMRFHTESPLKMYTFLKEAAAASVLRKSAATLLWA